MKRKEIQLSVIGIIMVIITAVIMCSSNKEMTFREDGIMYAVSVDGKKQNDFPAKGLYKVEMTCENAKCRWDYNNWKLYVEDITGMVSCDITFTTISKNYLNNKIISLSGTNQGTGKVINENGYRYEGKNPNNYIWFNNELWRIIGVFDAVSHGQSGQNLVKIIRDESLGGVGWETSDSNNWSTSSLKKLLNGAYYNKQDGTSGGYCYGYSTKVGVNCDYREKGINETYRGMIKNVTWYLGGMSNASTVSTIYAAERGDYGGASKPSLTSDTGYIGLMYPSDYGYSVLSSSCARTTSLSSYNTASCSGQSWLYGTGYEWLITSNSSNSKSVFYVRHGSLNMSSDSYFGYEYRPTLYLDSSVYVLDGDGSILNPYIIGM